MCLAEALLRIPDRSDALTRSSGNKLAFGDWRKHVGQSPSLFVNAATWGLVVTGKLVSTVNETGLAQRVDAAHCARRRARDPARRRHGDAA